MSLVASLGPVQLNNEWTDPHGSVYYMNRLEGWESTPLRQSAIQLPSNHGEVLVESLRNARLVTVGGICKATSESNFYASMYYMTGQWESVGSTMLLKVTEDRTRRLAVRRAGPVRTSYLGVGTFTWEISLRADDPTKYDDTADNDTISGTPKELTNAGTLLTYPTITLSASGTPTISCEAFEWRATGSLASGTVIDMKSQTVLSGGVSQFDKVDLTSDWFWLASGDNTVESNVNASITWRNGWQ